MIKSYFIAFVFFDFSLKGSVILFQSLTSISETVQPLFPREFQERFLVQQSWVFFPACLICNIRELSAPLLLKSSS